MRVVSTSSERVPMLTGQRSFIPYWSQNGIVSEIYFSINKTPGFLAHINNSNRVMFRLSIDKNRKKLFFVVFDTNQKIRENR